MASRKAKDWLIPEADQGAAAVAVSEPEPGKTASVSAAAEPSTAPPAWLAELERSREHAHAALEELDSWHRHLSKLQSQLEAVKADQQAALSDHDCDSEERVERIAAAQIREHVLAADLEHERVVAP